MYSKKVKIGLLVFPGNFSLLKTEKDTSPMPGTRASILHAEVFPHQGDRKTLMLCLLDHILIVQLQYSCREGLFQ